MCSTSVEPRPSMISRPDIAFQSLNTSADEHLGGGHGKAQAGEVGRLGLGRLGQRGVERRQAEEHGRPVAGDAVEDGGGRGWPGSSTLDAPTANGKVMRVAHAVGEEDLRHREAHVALGSAPAGGARRRGACRPCRAAGARCPSAGPSSPTSTSRTPCRRGACRRARAPAGGPASHGAAGCVATGPAAAASPLVTTRVSRRVPSQAVALNRSAKAASRQRPSRPNPTDRTAADRTASAC